MKKDKDDKDVPPQYRQSDNEFKNYLIVAFTLALICVCLALAGYGAIEIYLSLFTGK